MNDKLLAFARATSDAHIAIVEADSDLRHEQWTEVQRQFSSEGFSVQAWGRAHVIRYMLHLNNGTVIVFFTAEQHVQLLGWKFDRIETTPAVLAIIPDWFLANRLKYGIDPVEGISLREVEVQV